MAYQDHLVIVERVGRQLQKVFQGLNQETQNGNETVTPNAQVLDQLETKERMSFRNDPNWAPVPPFSSLCPVPPQAANRGGIMHARALF